jgi:hypothetical protein
MILTEKQIEEVFEVFHEELVEKGLVLLGRQHILENKLRIDLLFRDKNQKNLVLELKRDAISREDVGQLLQYAGLIKNSRVILAAPIISTSIKNAFDHYGIEYLEFDILAIENLYKEIKDKTVEQKHSIIQNIKLPQNIIKEPLLSKTKKDGNIAFKVTYTDSNWSGVCSPNVANYNFQHRTWCKIQSEFTENCQHKSFANPKKLDMYFFPCHDCIALKELMFYAGHYHGDKHDNEPIRCLDAKVGKIAVFSSREPGETEDERFIFAIGQMNYFEPVNDERGNYEYFHCDKSTALIFDKDNYPKFWKYYRNANNPGRIAWNTGLFRYLDDSTVLNLLEDITKSNAYSGELKEKAEGLISKI